MCIMKTYLANGTTTMKWFDELKVLLSEFFDIKVAHYLIFDIDTF